MSTVFILFPNPKAVTTFPTVPTPATDAPPLIKVPAIAFSAPSTFCCLIVFV